MKELTDEQLDDIWANSNPSNFEFKSAARAAIAADRALNGIGEAQPAEHEKGQEAATETSDQTDRLLRNNLGDDDYAEYFAALDVYTHPQHAQPAREWVGLTDDEVSCAYTAAPATPDGWKDFARAIESRLREKNAALLEADAQRPALSPLTDEQVTAGARELCRIDAWMCGTDFDDEWKTYGERFKADARACLQAAHGIKE